MKRIAILAETSLSSGRQIVAGISRFLSERADWSVFHPVGPLGAMQPDSIMEWQGDGIIARVANRELYELIRAKGLPTVDLLGNVRPSPFPLVKCNDRAIGATVAEHFLNNGHTNFAFLGLGSEYWSLEREEGFKKRLNERQDNVSVYHINYRACGKQFDGLDFETIKSWLSDLTAPVGIMVASDQFAPMIFEACHQLNLTIPQEVSVVGVDNDRPFYKLCRPRLSSVEPNHKLVGYRAAETLDQLLCGERPSQKVIEIDHHTLHQRLSSELIGVDDPAIVKAITYIREYACTGIGIDSVAAASGLSRSVLLRRFKLKLNRTVGELILSEKLLTARQMLSDTELSISIVAERSGFNSQEYMNYIFKKHLNTTPRLYRTR